MEHSKYHRKKDLKQKDLQSFSTKPSFFCSSILTLNEYSAWWKDAQFSWVLLHSELHASVSKMYPALSAKVTHWLSGWAVQAPAAISNQALILKANTLHISFTGAQVSFIRNLGNVKINWLGEYEEMAYCNTLPPVKEFIWTNIFLRTRVVYKKVPASYCVVEECVGMVPWVF